MLSEGVGNFIRPESFWRDVGLRAHQSVVHLGCGPGFYLIPAARIVGEKGKAFGIDVLEDKIAETLNRAKREGVEGIVRTSKGNLETEGGSGLEAASMDWVLTANILHQSDPGLIFKEAKRILKPDGRVVAVEWDTKASPFGPPDAMRVPRSEVVSKAESVGLKVEKEFDPSPYHYGLIFKAV